MTGREDQTNEPHYIITNQEQNRRERKGETQSNECPDLGFGIPFSNKRNRGFSEKWSCHGQAEKVQEEPGTSSHART